MNNKPLRLEAVYKSFGPVEVLRDFSLSITVGMLLGTYSSIFLASALALDIWISIDRRKGIPAE